MKKINGVTIALLLCVAVDLAVIVFCMLFFYWFQTEPTALIAAVFGVTFGECGFCTMIWKEKRKNTETEKEE